MSATSNNDTVYAITCPDGSFLPDEQADQCPDEDGNTPTNSGTVPGRPGSQSNQCLTNPDTPECTPLQTNEFEGEYQCGRGDNLVKTSINIGCLGENYPGNGSVNPIVDMMFALFRVLSAGVGLVVIGSVIVAGIQYATARGNPQATQAALKRVSNSFIALLIYIFMFALANFLVPGGMLI